MRVVVIGVLLWQLLLQSVLACTCVDRDPPAAFNAIEQDLVLSAPGFFGGGCAA